MCPRWSTYAVCYGSGLHAVAGGSGLWLSLQAGLRRNRARTVGLSTLHGATSKPLSFSFCSSFWSASSKGRLLRICLDEGLVERHLEPHLGFGLFHPCEPS